MEAAHGVRHTWAELADQGRAMAGCARAESRAMEERRVALARNALVWWQGESAEHYRQQVQERVVLLAGLCAELEALAGLADVLAEVASARAAVEVPAGEVPAGG